MADSLDPFRHTPELRGRIADPERSMFRSFRPEMFDAMAAQAGLPPDWRYTDRQRDTMFRAALAALDPGDVWVFAYGSLMWDPGFRFAEVRRARIAGHARRFILVDSGARGTPERPGLQAALDRGGDCEGLVFRITAEDREAELEILWRRERIAPAYREAMLPAETAQGTVAALAFLADHDVPEIAPHLTHDEQVEALASARGMLGPNLDYIVNLKTQLDALGITDDHIDRLHAAALARAAEIAGQTGKSRS